MFVACEKETETELQLNDANEQIVTKRAPGWGLNRKWDVTVLNCIDQTPYDCFDDVDIYPQSIILNFIRQINIGNNSNIRTFVANNFYDLELYIKPEHLNKIIRGEFDVSVEYNMGINTHFIILTDNNFSFIGPIGTGKHVYPFVSR